MTGRSIRLGRRNAEPDAAQRIAARVRERLGLGEASAVSVIEIACGEPACGGAETVILLMRPGRPAESIKLQQPLATVGESDVDAALGAFERREEELSVGP